jgi:CheY-like chemotaxis protein
MKGTPSETAPAARILLVDDNKLGLVARKSVLEDQGYRVTTAQEGQEAFERLLRDRFDLVITDYKMPKMNGLELIARIRGRQPEMPIILISGYADALGMTETSTGATVVIAKSATEVPQLIRSVNRLLRRPAQKKPVDSQRGQVKIKRQGAS